MLDWDDIAKRAAAEPSSELDLRQVVRRGQALGIQRFITLTATVVLVAVLGTTTVASLPFGDGDALPPIDRQAPAEQEFQPAKGDEDTYILSDFEVEYPYLAASKNLLNHEHYCELSEGACEPDPTQAEVLFTTHWSGNDYPGATECMVWLFGGDGEEVGSALFELSVLDPSIVERPNSVGVDVSASPTSADGACSASEYEPGPGYGFEFVEAYTWDPGYEAAEHETLPARSELVFDVEWLVENPDARYCRLIVEFTDGSSHRYDEYTLSGASPDKRYTVTIDEKDPTTIVDADIECRPYDRPPQSGVRTIEVDKEGRVQNQGFDRDR